MDISHTKAVKQLTRYFAWQPVFKPSPKLVCDPSIEVTVQSFIDLIAKHDCNIIQLESKEEQLQALILYLIEKSTKKIKDFPEEFQFYFPKKEHYIQIESEYDIKTELEEISKNIQDFIELCLNMLEYYLWQVAYLSSLKFFNNHISQKETLGLKYSFTLEEIYRISLNSIYKYKSTKKNPIKFIDEYIDFKLSNTIQKQLDNVFSEYLKSHVFSFGNILVKFSQQAYFETEKYGKLKIDKSIWHQCKRYLIHLFNSNTHLIQVSLNETVNNVIFYLYQNAFIENDHENQFSSWETNKCVEFDLLIFFLWRIAYLSAKYIFSTQRAKYIGFEYSLEYVYQKALDSFSKYRGKDTSIHDFFERNIDFRYRSHCLIEMKQEFSKNIESRIRNKVEGYIKNNILPTDLRRSCRALLIKLASKSPAEIRRILESYFGEVPVDIIIILKAIVASVTNFSKPKLMSNSRQDKSAKFSHDELATILKFSSIQHSIFQIKPTRDFNTTWLQKRLDEICLAYREYIQSCMNFPCESLDICEYERKALEESDADEHSQLDMQGIDTCFESLGPRQSEVRGTLFLKYGLDLAGQEISDILSITQATIANRNNLLIAKIEEYLIHQDQIIQGMNTTFRICQTQIEIEIDRAKLRRVIKDSINIYFNNFIDVFFDQNCSQFQKNGQNIRAGYSSNSELLWQAIKHSFFELIRPAHRHPETFQLDNTNNSQKRLFNLLRDRIYPISYEIDRS